MPTPTHPLHWGPRVKPLINIHMIWMSTWRAIISKQKMLMKVNIENFNISTSVDHMFLRRNISFCWVEACSLFVQLNRKEAIYTCRLIFLPSLSCYSYAYLICDIFDMLIFLLNAICLGLPCYFCCCSTHISCKHFMSRIN